jgi:hypothetical protein
MVPLISSTHNSVETTSKMPSALALRLLTNLTSLPLGVCSSQSASSSSVFNTQNTSFCFFLDTTRHAFDSLYYSMQAMNVLQVTIPIILVHDEISPPIKHVTKQLH